jgi:hypothetical protein
MDGYRDCFSQGALSSVDFVVAVADFSPFSQALSYLQLSPNLDLNSQPTTSCSLMPTRGTCSREESEASSSQGNRGSTRDGNEDQNKNQFPMIR